MKTQSMKVWLGYALILAATAVAGAASVTMRDDLSPADLARVEAVTKPATDFSKPENFEIMEGGAATSKGPFDANAFSQFSTNLSFADQERFTLGNGIFTKEWVTAPSSTQASDGLGPLFNARACQSCHIKDGGGHAPTSRGGDATSMLVRLSVPPDASQAAKITTGRLVAAADPVYGLQLQDYAAAGISAEGKAVVDYDDLPVTLSGGEVVHLRKPRLTIENPGYGPMKPEMMTSVRIAPRMIGAGLLEAIAPADILAQADPDDANHDGISGRPDMVMRPDGGLTLGRFGWKAIEPTVESQSAHAFLGDMGLSTAIAPYPSGECTAAQTACREAPNGVQKRLGDNEVSDDFFDLVVFYSRNLAVPARRNVDDPQVLKGKQAFYEAGCTACHTPKYVTSRNAIGEAQRFQLIWPYTDLLLHDMDEGLADHRTEGQATGTEWRTPPLWGIGLAKTVSRDAGFLHDGRARTIEEAILWHGGEAQAARDRFADMPKDQRDALIKFLESL